MNHRPYDALSGECGSPIPERHGCIQVHFAAPPDHEVDGCNWIEEYPTVPAGEIEFPDKNSLSGITSSCFLDEFNDGLGIGQREFPELAAVKVGVHKCIDAAVQLGAVHHGPSNFGPFLLDSVERAAIYPERKFGVVKGADESTETDFLINVVLNILLI